MTRTGHLEEQGDLEAAEGPASDLEAEASALGVEAPGSDQEDLRSVPGGSGSAARRLDRATCLAAPAPAADAGAAGWSAWRCCCCSRRSRGTVIS